MGFIADLAAATGQNEQALLLLVALFSSKEEIINCPNFHCKLFVMFTMYSVLSFLLYFPVFPIALFHRFVLYRSTPILQVMLHCYTIINYFKVIGSLKF